MAVKTKIALAVTGVVLVGGVIVGVVSLNSSEADAYIPVETTAHTVAVQTAPATVAVTTFATPAVTAETESMTESEPVATDEGTEPEIVTLSNPQTTQAPPQATQAPPPQTNAPQQQSGAVVDRGGTVRGETYVVVSGGWRIATQAERNDPNLVFCEDRGFGGRLVTGAIVLEDVAAARAWAVAEAARLDWSTVTFEEYAAKMESEQNRPCRGENYGMRTLRPDGRFPDITYLNPTCSCCRRFDGQ